MQIKKVENKGNDIQLAYLEGVIMPNGEFVHNGKTIWLEKEDKVFIEDKNNN